MSRPSIGRKYLEGKGDVFGPTIPSDQHKELLADIRTFEAERKKRARYNYTAAENQQWADEQIFRLKEKHYVQNQQIVASIEAEIEKIKADHEQRADVNKSLLEYTKWKTRYSSMDKEALLEDADNYLQNDSIDYTPERLDSLNEALAREKVTEVGYAQGKQSAGGSESGPVEKHDFATWIEQRRGHEPWLKEKPELVRALNLYSAPLGKMRILEENGEQIQEFDIVEAIEK